MRTSRIILLLVALLAGGLAAFLATRGDAPRQVVVEGPTQVIEEKKTQVLVAKTAIGVGERLSIASMEWQDWPEFAVRAEYINKATLPDALTEMNDAVARFEFFPGEPILEQKLVRTDQGYLSAVLAKGMRGVSVQVDAESAAGGYIMPNDRVDVVMTRTGTNGTVSETILSNVKVLAIDRRLGEAGSSGAPTDPADPRADVFQKAAIATLELDPGQGELIINSAKTGTLSLSLRSITDFAATAEQLQQNTTSRSIRVIRAGRGSDTMPISSGSGGEISLAPAAFSEPADEEEFVDEAATPNDDSSVGEVN